MIDFQVGDRIKITSSGETGFVTQVINQGCDELNFVKVKLDENSHWDPVLVLMDEVEKIDK